MQVICVNKGNQSGQNQHVVVGNIYTVIDTFRWPGDTRYYYDLKEITDDTSYWVGLFATLPNDGEEITENINERELTEA